LVSHDDGINATPAVNTWQRIQVFLPSGEVDPPGDVVLCPTPCQVQAEPKDGDGKEKQLWQELDQDIKLGYVAGGSDLWVELDTGDV